MWVKPNNLVGDQFAHIYNHNGKIDDIGTTPWGLNQVRQT
jgi:hypothetical protein